MISQAGTNRRGGRFLVLALALSLAIHALLAALTSWLWLVKLPALTVKPPHETVTASTALRIERRTVPRPPARPLPHPRPVAAAQLPKRSGHSRVSPAAPHRELARQAPSAPPQPTAQPTEGATSSLARELANQQHDFSQEIARLRAQNNPLAIAPKTNAPPAAFHRSYFDVAGHRDFEAVQFWLIPLRHWYAGSTICYYTHYTAQYRNGGSEEGTIPWPICYPIGDDRIANPPYVHEVPVPIPPPDYVLPPGTYLSPLLAEIYSSRPTQH
jgi:hypothetical protein